MDIAEWEEVAKDMSKEGGDQTFLTLYYFLFIWGPCYKNLWHFKRDKERVNIRRDQWMDRWTDGQQDPFVEKRCCIFLVHCVCTLFEKNFSF